MSDVTYVAWYHINCGRALLLSMVMRRLAGHNVSSLQVIDSVYSEVVAGPNLSHLLDVLGTMPGLPLPLHQQTNPLVYLGQILTTQPYYYEAMIYDGLGWYIDDVAQKLGVTTN
jgi:hypothetical protein